MNRAARYLVAQHVTDLFRNEPRNVGVFVAMGNERTARFFGETVPGKIDGRSLKQFDHPDVYRQWIEYWTETLKSEADPLSSLLSSTGQHYRVINGGTVEDVGSDSIHDVAAFLFASLVGEGMAKALGGEEADAISVPLQQDVESIFDELNLLAGDDPRIGQVKHPIRRNANVRGQTAQHKPAFFQQNGHPIVMETVDLTAVSKKQALRDHAGWAAFMFGDIRAASRDAETIAITRSNAQVKTEAIVGYALEMLKSNARVVDWGTAQERDEFVEERRRIAQG